MQRETRFSLLITCHLIDTKPLSWLSKPGLAYHQWDTNDFFFVRSSVPIGMLLVSSASLCVNIGSGNGLAPVWCQTIFWTNEDVVNWYLKDNELKWNLNQAFFFQLKDLKNVVPKMATILFRLQCVNTLRLRQNGRHFPDDIFKCIFLNENLWISIQISLKFVPKGPINNIPALVQVMAWRQPGDKPLSDPMMIKFTDAYMHHSASMS